MNRSTLRRRHFLAALGLAGVTGNRRVRAEEYTSAPAVTTPAGIDRQRTPPRFVGIYAPHGMAHELWQPGPDFDLSYPNSILAPFDDVATYGRSFKDRLLVIDGLDLAAGIEVGTVGHEAARVILTGSGANGKNASIDQFLAVEQMLGAETPRTSLVLGVGSDGSEIGTNISYASGGTPIPKLIDPTQTFDELFGKPLSGAERAELEALRGSKRSVLDFLRKDLQRLGSTAPTSERLKFEQHLSALREIEKRLSPAARNCPAPARPTSTSHPKLAAYGGGEPYFETITNLQIDLLAQAIACDLTRFATLFLADLSRTELYPDLPRDVHIDVAHLYDARTEKGPGNPKTWLPLARQNRHSCSKIARLMQRLAEAQVLDATLIYASSDMGDPARHSSRNVPTLLAGSTQLGFKLGRYLDLKSEKGDKLLPHNRLLVSICQAFGVPTQSFGHSAKLGTVSGHLDALAG